MAKTYTGPDELTLRRTLSALVTGGLVPYHVGDVGEPLLDLEIVRSEMPDAQADDDDGDAYDVAATAALSAVLARAIDKKQKLITSRKLRRVLRHVLPLRDELVGKPIGDRRASAAEAIKGKKVVKASTIRTYYEPKALKLLAHALVQMEAGHRQEEPPTAI
jgi:hypothetical protein